MLINHLISMVCVCVCVIISSSHSPNIWGDPIADQLLELVCKLKMFILVLTESTVQFVACGCRAIKVLQERRWPVGAVLHFCVSNLGSCHPCGRWFKRFHQPKHCYIAQTCYGAANGSGLFGFPQIPQVTNKTNKKTPRLPDIHQGDKHSGAAKLLSSGLRCFPPLSSLWHSLPSWCLRRSC